MSEDRSRPKKDAPTVIPVTTNFLAAWSIILSAGGGSGVVVDARGFKPSFTVLGKVVKVSEEDPFVSSQHVLTVITVKSHNVRMERGLAGTEAG